MTIHCVICEGAEAASVSPRPHTCQLDLAAPVCPCGSTAPHKHDAFGRRYDTPVPAERPRPWYQGRAYDSWVRGPRAEGV